MELKNKITIILGPLRLPLAKLLATTKQSPSTAMRAALAAYLGVDEPSVPMGNPRHRENKLNQVANASKRKSAAKRKGYGK